MMELAMDVDCAPLRHYSDVSSALQLAPNSLEP